MRLCRTSSTIGLSAFIGFLHHYGSHCLNELRWRQINVKFLQHAIDQFKIKFFVAEPDFLGLASDSPLFGSFGLICTPQSAFGNRQSAFYFSTSSLMSLNDT